MKIVQARRESTSVQKRSEVHKRREGVFLGSKGAQEELFWRFKGALWRTKVYDVAKCTIFRLCCSMKLYSRNDAMKFARA